MKEVMSGFPADLPAAVLIVQHLVSTRKTQLNLLLDRISPLRVIMAEDRSILEPGTAYLAEPGKHLSIENGHLVLSCSKKVHFVRPSADTLFISAANAFGWRVIGIILSGSGSDGTSGCLEIKAKGGVIIVQDEKTSPWFGMPGAAIKAGAVDYVLPLAEIAGKIVELVAGGRRSVVRRQKTEDRGQRTEDRGQRSEDRGQRTEDRGQRTVSSNQ